jgi:hypothetical protein
MGTSFFKSAGAAPKALSGGPQNAEARAIGAGGYASRSAGMGASKSLGVAEAINKAGKFKPMKRSAAYPPGPKV